MELILSIYIIVIGTLFGLFVMAFLVAGIMDLITARRRRRDVFYQLQRDHNSVKRPAAK